MKDCTEVLGCLAAFAADELSPARRSEVREHLQHCCGCRREAGLQQRAQAALAAFAREAVAPGHDAMLIGLHEAILASTVASAAAAPAPVGGATSGSSTVASGRLAVPSPRVVGLAAAALLLGVGFLIGAGSGTGVDRPVASELGWSVGSHGPAHGPATGGAVSASFLVVPYAGPRVELRPLGFERSAAEWLDPNVRGTGPASGLLARRELRTLVEEGAPIPPAVPPRVSSVGADAAPR